MTTRGEHHMIAAAALCYRMPIRQDRRRSCRAGMPGTMRAVRG